MVKVIKKKKDDKLPIVIIVCFVVTFVISLACFIFENKGNLTIPKDARNMSYTHFLEDLNEGKVEEASISETSEYFIFKLKDDEKTYKASNPGTENFKEMLLSNGVDVTDYDLKRDDGFTRIILISFKAFLVACFVAMIIVYFVFGWNFLKRQEAREEKVKEVRFKDIIGLDEIKEELLFLVSLTKEKEKRNNLRLPRGILLEGPPGNGKTMLARAIATEAEMNFISSSADELKSAYISETGKKITKLFKQAKENAPCILFFDEIDALCSKRSGTRDSADKEMNGILNTFLTMLDGIEDSGDVIVIAATNLADNLDPAFLRPGRFDKRFMIGNPDSEARKKLFAKYLDDSSENSQFDFDRLSSISYGISCAGIENIVNEAKLLATREKRETITEEDIINAFRNYTMKGVPKKNAVYSDNEKKVVAIHEAGHAIAAHFYAGKIVDEVSIHPTTSGFGGYTQARNGKEVNLHNMEDIFGNIVMILAGKAAEEEILGDKEKVSLGSDSDLTEATKLAVSFVKFTEGFDYSVFGNVGDEKLMGKAKEIMDEAYIKAQEVMEMHYKKLKEISTDLFENEVISRERFLEIVG